MRPSRRAHSDGKAFEIEFMTLDGQTAAIAIGQLAFPYGRTREGIRPNPLQRLLLLARFQEAVGSFHASSVRS